MTREIRRPGAWALEGDSAFLAELVRLVPCDAAFLGGVEDSDELGSDLRALLREARKAGRPERVPLTFYVSPRLADLFLDDGARLYALSDPWAFLDVLRRSVRSPRPRGARRPTR